MVKEEINAEQKSYLVCPTRWTRPMACSSAPMFSDGSTSSTCVASTIFNPFDPDDNCINATFKEELVLNSLRLCCKDEEERKKRERERVSEGESEGGTRQGE